MLQRDTWRKEKRIRTDSLWYPWMHRSEHSLVLYCAFSFDVLVLRVCSLRWVLIVNHRESFAFVCYLLVFEHKVWEEENRYDLLSSPLCSRHFKTYQLKTRIWVIIMLYWHACAHIHSYSVDNIDSNSIWTRSSTRWATLSLYHRYISCPRRANEWATRDHPTTSKTTTMSTTTLPKISSHPSGRRLRREESVQNNRIAFEQRATMFWLSFRRISSNNFIGWPTSILPFLLDSIGFPWSMPFRKQYSNGG